MQDLLRISFYYKLLKLCFFNETQHYYIIDLKLETKLLVQFPVSTMNILHISHILISSILSSHLEKP